MSSSDDQMPEVELGPGGVAPDAVETALKEAGLDATTGTAEIRIVIGEPGMEDGKWVFFDEKPIKRVG